MTEPVSFDDFAFVRDLVYAQSAIALDDGKEYLIEARLAPIARREGLPSVTELVQTLRRGGTRLRDDVVAAVATNETTFFRDVHPFDALRDVIIPATLAANDGKGLSIWSAAASTGQEAYSVAMVMAEHFRNVVNVRILGTDFSEDVLIQARLARFSQLEVNRGLPIRMLVRHFTHDGAAWQLSDEIRRMVQFRQLNLARPFVGMPSMDIVLLRNVLIYFDMPTKVQVLQRVVGLLRPGGYLILGGAETTYGISKAFERVQLGKTIGYRLREPSEGTS